MSDDRPTDERFPEPDESAARNDGHDNTPEIDRDLRLRVNKELFDYEVTYLLRHEVIGTQRISGEAWMTNAAARMRQGGYDEYRWVRVDRADQSTQKIIDVANRETRSLEMPQREPGLFRGIIARLKIQWKNPMWPHE